jgi:hypothetical protein
MRHLLAALSVSCVGVLSCTVASAADTVEPRASAEVSTAAGVEVSKCFKVNRLLKTDATHYWADWSNTCPYTIDAVYVMVGFLDRGRQEMGNGVWPMYFVTPGAHRVTRFSAPVADFETVHVHRITTDSALALRPDRAAAAEQSATPGKVVDRASGTVVPYPPRVAGNRTKY